MSRPPLAAAPTEAVPVPDAVAAAAGHHPVTAVWRNILGGVTFRVDDPRCARHIKWSPPGGPDLTREAQRLTWARRYVTVPAVLGQGADREGSWLITASLAGHNAVSEPWRGRPRVAARAIGLGLAQLHARLPAASCPFRHGWAAPFAADDPDLPRLPPVDRPVVCHGDPCAPNTLIGEDGRPAGHVDLGSLGVADRWADLAIATWSLDWNFGPGLEADLLDAYGTAPDPLRIAAYWERWDLVG